MTSRTMMVITLMALLPGFFAYSWLFGAGVIFNLAFTLLVAVATEAVVLKLRNKPLKQLKDMTVIVTSVLLALCLPPLLPFWMIAIGTVFAVIFGKHVYGGVGQNLFNPAMIGFAVLILAFPLAMSQWPAAGADDSSVAVLKAKLATTENRADYDGVTAATPLDSYKFRDGQTNSEFFNGDNQENWMNWVLINLGFLIGGVYLLYRKIIPWQTPVAFLATLGLLGLVFYDAGSSASLGSPAFHLLSGATMLAAFFIVTDPVTSPGYTPGLLIFGSGVAIITFVIRTGGAYPEGVAFAVLFMNAASPLIDHVFARRDERLAA